MIDLVRIEFVGLAKALMVLSTMTIIGLPLTVAWGSLRGSLFLPAVLWTMTLITALAWAGGQL